MEKNLKGLFFRADFLFPVIKRAEKVKGFRFCDQGRGKM